MKKYQLDKEEQELLDAFESGEFQSDLSPSRKKFVEQSAAQTFKKDKKIKALNGFQVGRKETVEAVNP